MRVYLSHETLLHTSRRQVRCAKNSADDGAVSHGTSAYVAPHPIMFRSCNKSAQRSEQLHPSERPATCIALLQGMTGEARWLAPPVGSIVARAKKVREYAQKQRVVIYVSRLNKMLHTKTSIL